MRYRRLGHWGVKISEITLGTWLTHGGGVREEIAIKCTRRAYELGVNLFDTANEYQKGRAEEVLGKALSVFPRDNYVVATKVYSPMGNGPLERGLSRKHIMAQIDSSLRRLGLDHIDLYQCHRYDAETPLEETAAAMNDLVQRGKVLYWGVSEWSADQTEHVVALCREQCWAVPISNQLHYSALWREHEEAVLPACETAGMGVLAFSPLAHGVLAGKYRAGGQRPHGSRGAGADGWMLDRYLKSEILQAVQEFRLLAEETGSTAAQLALAWCLHRDVVSSVIIGASRLSQLEENIAASDLVVDAEILERADKLLLPVATA